MNIEELLTKYTDLAHKREQAYEVFKTFDIKIDNLVYDNEEPFELSYLNGEPTGIKIKTPDDVADIITGCVIAIGGAEWMRCGDKWISCYDAKKEDHEMFIHILRNSDHVHLIHKGY